jgi:hypothetical protein
MRRVVVIGLAGTAALMIGAALISGANAQMKRPPAVLIGAGSAARFITGSAAAGIAGARPAECEPAKPAPLA